LTSASPRSALESKLCLPPVSGDGTRSPFCLTRRPDPYVIDNHRQAQKHRSPSSSRRPARTRRLLGIQAPLAPPTQKQSRRGCTRSKRLGTDRGALISEKDKPPTVRDRTGLAGQNRDYPLPNHSTLNAPISTGLFRDLLPRRFDGGRLTQSYAVTSKVLESLPAESPTRITVPHRGDVDSPAFAALAAAATGRLTEPDLQRTQATRRDQPRHPKPSPRPRIRAARHCATTYARNRARLPAP